MSHCSLHSLRVSFWTGKWLSFSMTQPYRKSGEGVEWSHSSAWKSSICLIHESAFEFAWLVVQLPLTLADTGLKDLTLGGDLPPEEVIDCTSVSDIYSKGFMLLILREGNNMLLELERDTLSCFVFFLTCLKRYIQFCCADWNFCWNVKIIFTDVQRIRWVSSSVLGVHIIYMSVSDDPKNENIKCFCFN